MNENMDTKVEKLRPFTRFCMTIGELPTSYLMSMTYLEQVLWFTKYLQETVIPAINNNATAVEEIQNFLKTLDLQDEVNNKLDEMAQDGTLENLIGQYINPYVEDFTSKSDGNLEYMFTIHSTEPTFQGLCCDNENYYYYNLQSHNLYKRSLSTNELLDTFYLPSFGHGNDLTIIDNVIYTANVENKNINYYNLVTNDTGYLDCLDSVSDYVVISGITKDENNDLIVSLYPQSEWVSQRIDSMGLFKVHIATNTYEELNVTNTKHLNLKSTSVIQAIEYANDKLYVLTSQPTMITQYIKTEDGFNAVNIFSYDSYDIHGLPYGESEGIALLPDTYNGKNTLLVYSQMQTGNSSNSLKFYCFNAEMRLPLTKIPHQQDANNQMRLEPCYINVNATNYYEDGTTNYPFKTLNDGINALNFDKYLHFRACQIVGAGNYYLDTIRSLKIVITSSIAGVNIYSPMSFTNNEVFIEGDDTNLINIIASSGFYVSGGFMTLRNVNYSYNGNTSSNFYSTRLLIDRCTWSTTTGINFTNTIASLNFRSFTSTVASGKYFNVDRNNIVAFSNPTSIIPTEAINKGYSVCIRYNSIQNY